MVHLRLTLGLLATGIVLSVVAGACTGQVGSADRLGASESQAVSGASISVREDGTTRTLVCNQTNVLVSGHHNIVTLTGPCGTVSVPGDGNQVSIEDAARLSVPGDNNTLDVQRVDSVRLDGHYNHLAVQSAITRSKPAITNRGEGNVVASGGAG